jgi:hypothetical protein
MYMCFRGSDFDSFYDLSIWFSATVPTMWYLIHTHYIHSVLVQVESVVWTSITTSRHSNELWCGLFTQQARPDKVLYQHTMYVISLSNISIKTNFKQITRVELKFVQYSQGDYILCMTSCYFFRSFTNARGAFNIIAARLSYVEKSYWTES